MVELSLQETTYAFPKEFGSKFGSNFGSNFEVLVVHIISSLSKKTKYEMGPPIEVDQSHAVSANGDSNPQSWDVKVVTRTNERPNMNSKDKR